jgi:hypothetical protein
MVDELRLRQPQVQIKNNRFQATVRKEFNINLFRDQGSEVKILFPAILFNHLQFNR